MKDPIINENRMRKMLFGAFTLLLLFTTSLIFHSAKAQSGEALSFDGVDDYVDLPFVVQNSYTKEAWVKINMIDGNQHNIISGTGTAFYIINGYLYAGHSPSYSQVSSPSALTVGVWHHVAVTYDHTTLSMKLYVDGGQVASGTAPAYTDTKNYIGAFDIGTADYFFVYNMDEVRIWNTALTAGQITAYSGCSLTNSESNLSAHYTFNQGIAAGDNTSISLLTDSGPNGYNGTIYGFALNGASSNFVNSGVTFSGPCAVLAVEIMSFKAEKANSNSVNLEWKTSPENVQATYTIERTTDPNGEWMKIGTADSYVSTGVENVYHFIDASPVSGVNYYRVKQSLSTGEQKYTAIRNVKFDEIFKAFSIYPTITKNEVTVELKDPSLIGTTLLVLDNAGRIIRKQVISEIREKIGVSNLTGGMYFVKAIKGETQKFVKQ